MCWWVQKQVQKFRIWISAFLCESFHRQEITVSEETDSMNRMFSLLAITDAFLVRPLPHLLQSILHASWRVSDTLSVCKMHDFIMSGLWTKMLCTVTGMHNHGYTFSTLLQHLNTATAFVTLCPVVINYHVV